MTIFHKAYLFKPSEFGQLVRPYMDDLEESSNGYDRVRSEGISLYDTSAGVKKLADEYGGWDRYGIVKDIPEHEPRDPDDIAFWFILLLYGSLAQAGKQLGLGNSWQRLDKMLVALGWDVHRRDLLINGHDFSLFARKWLAGPGYPEEQDKALLVWSHMNWTFQSGGVGWLGLDDIVALLRKLSEDERRLRDSRVLEGTQAELIGLHDQIHVSGDRLSVPSVYQAAVDMLRIAVEERSGLCIILSG